MQTDGGPGGFSTVQHWRMKKDSPGSHDPGLKGGPEIFLSPSSNKAIYFLT
jgi:hypothetical protein